MTTQPTAPWQLVHDHVSQRAAGLQSDLLSGSAGRSSDARAQLAELRRASADDPSDPRVWAMSLAGLPLALAGTATTDAPTRAELSVHAALVLFATHAQSATVPRHRKGRRLGMAVRDLAGGGQPGKDIDQAIVRRFQTFATATSWRQRIWYLRGLVSLMRSHDVPLDYGSLAADLYQSQTPEGLRRVRLQWGRDFHRVVRPATDQDPTDTAAPAITHPDQKEN